MLKPKETIEKLEGYFVPLYEKDWEIKIDSNENNYGPSPKVIDAIKKCDIKNISYYPFYGEISQKIADYYGFDNENIKVTNGADEAIQAIIQTYLRNGSSLLTLDISFEMPAIYTKIQGGEVIKVPYKTKWDFPIEEFISELKNKNAGIVYIASPNNPTGSIIKENDLIKILENSNEKAVIIDETYANYCDISYKNYAEQYDNVFIVRSFSKDFALAGLRLGCIISSKGNIKTLKKVISPYSVNSIAIIAGITALDELKYFQAVKHEINDSKIELTRFFENLGGKVYNSYANFLLADFKEKSEFIYNKLKNESISVKLYKKGSPLEGHLRITIPTKYGVEKIKQTLKIKPALVFDMDGVLINASNSYRAAIEKTVEKYTGKKIPPEEIQQIKNQGGMNNDWDLTEYLIKKEGLNIPYEDIVKTFQQIYWDNGKGLINKENILFNPDLFKKLSKNYNLSIFTGRLKAEAIYALERFNIKDLFLTIITTDDIPQGKGKPDPYGLIRTKEITISDEYYYFGDTLDDIKAAKSANYKAVGVLPPQDKSEELHALLIKNGADYVINSINEAETILEKDKNEAMH